MYRGLPVITNKISVPEQRNIPHHLLGNIGLEEETWVVGRFKREASRIIAEIRSRGKLPIVVGGTHYYINGLLFEGGVVQDRTDEQTAEQEADSRARFPILNASTEEILANLREVDPVMADRWHPNDRRKISRSLEIYLTTGRRASDIYEEQKQQQQASNKPEPQTKWTPLLFWVYSKPDMLNTRLATRIDKMLDQGLMDEITSMHSYLISLPSPPDRTKGIWQSIGFKEFEPYLTASPATTPEKELEKLKDASVERMKISTRQYARSQLRWITHKTLPALTTSSLLPHLFLLDSTDKSAYTSAVINPAVSITQSFLAGDSLPDPKSISPTAADVLADKLESSERAKKERVWNQKTCEVCGTTVLTVEAWDKHVRGRGHRRAVYRKGRMAVAERRGMEVEVWGAGEEKQEEKNGGSAKGSGSGSGSEDEDEYLGLDFGRDEKGR